MTHIIGVGEAVMTESPFHSMNGAQSVVRIIIALVSFARIEDGIREAIDSCVDKDCLVRFEEAERVLE